MMQERAITIETSIVSAGAEFFVRVAYDGKQRLELGPVDDKDAACRLADAISQSARAAIDFLLETHQWPLKVPG